MEIKVKFDTQGALLSGKGPAIVQRNLDAFITDAAAFLAGQVQARTPQGALNRAGTEPSAGMATMTFTVDDMLSQRNYPDVFHGEFQWRTD